MGFWGQSPQLLGDFHNILAEIATFGITFRTFSEPFERTKFLRFESQLKKSLPSLQVKSNTRLKSYILGLNFVTWPSQGNQCTLLSATFLALNNLLEDLR